MKLVLLDGDGAAGLAAYRALREASGIVDVVCGDGDEREMAAFRAFRVAVNAPPGELADEAARDGVLVDSATATFVGVYADEIVEAFDP